MFGADSKTNQNNAVVLSALQLFRLIWPVYSRGFLSDRCCIAFLAIKASYHSYFRGLRASFFFVLNDATKYLTFINVYMHV